MKSMSCFSAAGTRRSRAGYHPTLQSRKSTASLEAWSVQRVPRLHTGGKPRWPPPLPYNFTRMLPKHRITKCL